MKESLLFSLRICFARNTNQSNYIKSLITKILNARAQVLKIKWLQGTQFFLQESINNDMLQALFVALQQQQHFDIQ